MFGIEIYSRSRCVRIEISSSDEHFSRPKLPRQKRLYDMPVNMYITLHGTALLAILELLRRIAE